MRDADDFRDFVIHAHPRLLRAAYLLTGDQFHAEDLVQAALAKAAVSWQRVKRADQPHAYVRRIMANLHVSRWRRHRRERLTPDLPDAPALSVETGRCEDRAVLRAALAGLTPRQRAVIVLRFYEDLSIADTADVLGCSTGTVKSLSSRGLAELRTRLTALEASYA